IALVILALVIGLPVFAAYYGFSKLLNRPGGGPGIGWAGPSHDVRAKVEINPGIDDESAIAFEAKLKELTGSDKPWSNRGRFFEKTIIEVAPVPKDALRQYADKIDLEYPGAVTHT